MRWLKTKTVCEMLQISRTTLYNLVQKGEIPQYKIGSMNRYSEDEVLAYMKGERK